MKQLIKQRATTYSTGDLTTTLNCDFMTAALSPGSSTNKLIY